MDSNEQKSSQRVYLIVFSTYLYSFTNHAALSWSSPVLPQLRQHDLEKNPLGRRITENEESWLASLLSLGNMVGLLVYGYLCYKFGRKHSLTSLGALHSIGFLLFTTKSLTCFYIGRFLNGLASGVGIIMFPMYISEICRDSDRGLLLVSRQVFSSCGTLFAYVAGNYMSLFWFNTILSVFPIAFMISFSILATESPYYHMMRNDHAAAKKVYIELVVVDNRQTREDVDEIKKTVEMSQAESLKEALSRKSVLKAIILVYFMFIFQQLTGYMPLATYIEIIVSSRRATILVGLVLLIGSFFSTFVIDRKGRKLLFYISLAGIIFIEVSFSCIQFYFSFSTILTTVFFIAFFLLYNIGVAFIPQIVAAEILPLSLKFKVASTASVLGWGTAFLLTKFFLVLTHTIGLGWIMLGFALGSCIYLIIVVLFLPETKGRSFRQIQSLLEVDPELE